MKPPLEPTTAPDSESTRAQSDVPDRGPGAVPDILTVPDALPEPAHAPPGSDTPPESDAPPEPGTVCLPRQRTFRGRRARAMVTRSVVRFPTGGGVEPLIAVHRATFPHADVALLYAAYEVAEREHRGQRRKSGEPYITHPVAVATILAELGMDTTTLVAALLHDTVEDTSYTLANAREGFGAEVAHLVDGVTKIDKVEFGPNAEAETFRKLLVWGGRDVRVLVIKLADRLHNMRTLGFRARDKQLKTAAITQQVLIPLTDRLGIQVIKRELEDLVFAIAEPDAHAHVAEELRTHAAAHRERLDALIAAAAADLHDAGIRARVTDRPRHHYSAHRSMRRHGEESLGASAVARLLVVVSGEPHECYVAVGVLHGRWAPLPGRFKDYVAIPKYNLYRSLHTSVLGPDGETVEVLVRTEDMHRRAEYGIAATIQEASGNGSRVLDTAERNADELDWMRRLLEWQRQAADPEEFLASLTLDLAEGEIIVFTPKGEAVTLPAGATAVDFAYAVRTDIGHRAIGTRINGRLVPLVNELVEGDVVEILTGDLDRPSPEWLPAVRTPQARLRIRHWQAVHRREEAIDIGRGLVTAALHVLAPDVSDAFVRAGLDIVADILGQDGQDELLIAVRDGAVAPAAVADGLAGLLPSKEDRSKEDRHPR